MYVGEHVVMPLTVGLFARVLYDTLKDRKDDELRIDGQKVEIDAQRIEQFIINAAKEEMTLSQKPAGDSRWCPKCKDWTEKGKSSATFTTEVTSVECPSLVGDGIDVYVCPNCGYMELYAKANPARDDLTPH